MNNYYLIKGGNSLMRNFKFVLILGLIATLSLGLISCGDGGNGDGNLNNGGTSLLIPVENARDAGDWELPIVANAGDFSIQDKVRLSEVLSNPDVKCVIVDFWATWCEPCKQEMPYLQKIYEDFKDNGLAMLVITIDSSPELEEEIKKDVVKLGVTYPIPWDIESEVKSFYGIQGIPVTYLIDKEGKIRYEHSGFTEELVEDLRLAVEELISQ